MNPLSADTAIIMYAKEKEIAAKLEEKKEIGAKLLEEENAAAEKDSEMAEVWKDFPSELHQHILQYCSVPELCRLRIVCRAWNDLIHHSTHFASRAQLHNRYICISADDVDIRYNYTRSKRDAVNTNLRNRNGVITSLSNSWKLIDLSTKKFYWINKVFLFNDLLNEFASKDYFDRWLNRGPAFVDFHRIMAADKGLLCVLWKSFWRDVMQIVNSVTRSVTEVPLFRSDRRVYTSMRGAMTVAEDYSSFTLYFIFESIVGDRMLSLARFDSQVAKWRELYSQPWSHYFAHHLLKLNESLYTLLCNEFEMLVFAVNTVSETWTNTRLELPTKLMVMAQLVTALGRLFIVMLDKRNDADFSVRILEINVFSNTYSILTTMDSILTTMEEKCPGGEIPKNNNFQAAFMTAVGCGNFIVLTSNTGWSIAYDMLNNVWSEWSSRRLFFRWMSKQEVDIINVCSEWSVRSFFRWMSAQEDDSIKCEYGLGGMAMTLTLNPVPRLQQHH